MDLITPEYGLFVWQVVVLFVLIFLLTKFAWKPVMKAVGEREASINDALASAERAKEEMANLKADNEKLLQQARAERDEMLKEAQDMKKSIISEATEDANEKSERILEKAQITIQSEKKQALLEIKSQVAELSVQIAETVVKKQLDDKKEQMTLVNKMLDDVKLN
ncbi:ATP synthase B chain AtpF [Psychroflexus torquis ATCC 700755]|uniref:ATP synthase subunit b n=1 Tax=Psychroflexus torquis (strain ATCC 700755 / CIP 106069 / ACAM 623) TaxID=313595 RepID=K4ITI5_PSYTT|nr:F0F1 ATP synthase subunit B [Psychroflexus torquis]AFU68795.1 ATP synthase B chain AtpF [Psychroflexus torquis ATCC 700755]